MTGQTLQYCTSMITRALLVIIWRLFSSEFSSYQYRSRIINISLVEIINIFLIQILDELVVYRFQASFLLAFERASRCSSGAQGVLLCRALICLPCSFIYHFPFLVNLIWFVVLICPLPFVLTPTLQLFISVSCTRHSSSRRNVLRHRAPGCSAARWN